MKTISFIKKAPWNGIWNGYVAITRESKYFGKDYGEIDDVIVHGGLTYSEPLVMSFINEGTEIVDGSIEDFDEPMWVLGFDCSHSGDNMETCPKEYTIKWTNKLKEQLCKQ